MWDLAIHSNCFESPHYRKNRKKIYLYIHVFNLWTTLFMRWFIPLIISDVLYTVIARECSFILNLGKPHNLPLYTAEKKWDWGGSHHLVWRPTNTSLWEHLQLGGTVKRDHHQYWVYAIIGHTAYRLYPHYENTPIQIYWKIHHQKMNIFK